MYLLRPVNEEDLDDLVELAQHLDTLNFPNDRNKLLEGIDLSIKSFSNKKNSRFWTQGEYQFVLEDTDLKRVLGVSKIIAHHGNKEKPHYFWQISRDHRESKTLGIGITHQVLQLKKDSKGHTEIAGIIVHPKMQGKQLGKQLFYIRFLYIFLNKTRFLNRIISELLPPLDKTNKSVLWEAYGRKFTGLTYQEADQLSHETKEFIETLFPQNKIYTCLLPIKARQVIGKVGAKSKPVCHLAKKNNLLFLNQIDPFDGGPHFGCKTNQVKAIQNTIQGRAELLDRQSKENLRQGLICNGKNTGLDFKATPCACLIRKQSNHLNLLSCPKDILASIDAKPGDFLTFLPYT